MNYCTHCGQTTHVHRLMMGQLFHELFHAVTDTDKRILHLVKHLALRPARAAIEYWKVPAKNISIPLHFY